MTHTCESLNAVLRAELPGWEVYDQSPYVKAPRAAAVARRGDWCIKLLMYDSPMTCILTMDDDFVESGEREVHYASIPASHSPDPAVMIHTAIARARAWVAALQEGCP